MKSGYTQVSYIYTNGGYVNTGISKEGSGDTFRVNMELEFVSLSSTQGIFGSSGTSAGYQYSQNIQATTGKKWVYSWRNSTATSSVTFALNTKYKIDAQFSRYNDQKYLKIDNSASVIDSSSFSESDYPSFPIYLFALNNDGAAENICTNIKFYSCNVYHPVSTQVRAYVPAMRTSDGAYGLYDTKNDTFITSSKFTGPVTSTKLKISGTWKDTTPYIKVNGSWKKVSRVWYNVSGTWK